MKEIVVIATVCPTAGTAYNIATGKYFSSSDGYWQTAAANQCLAVITALVSDKEGFMVKVLTPAPSDSTFARAIRSAKPEILLCGFDVDKTEAVAKAIDGAYGIFFVTDVSYKRDDSVADEVAIGRSIADACLECDVQHVVYSTQMHVYASIGLRSDPCDGKAHVAEYLTAKEVSRTLLVVPFLYEDFLYGLLKPTKMNQKNFSKIIAPTGYIPFDSIGMRDVGMCVKSIFENTKQWLGKTVTLSGDKMTLKEYAQTMTNHTYPHTILDGQLTPEEFMDRNDWNGAEDMANFFDYLTRGVQRNNQVTTMLLENDVASFYDWTNLNKENVIKCISE